MFGCSERTVCRFGYIPSSLSPSKCGKFVSSGSHPPNKLFRSCSTACHGLRLQVDCLHRYVRVHPHRRGPSAAYHQRPARTVAPKCPRNLAETSSVIAFYQKSTFASTVFSRGIPRKRCAACGFRHQLSKPWQMIPHFAQKCQLKNFRDSISTKSG